MSHWSTRGLLGSVLVCFSFSLCAPASAHEGAIVTREEFCAGGSHSYTCWDLLLRVSNSTNSGQSGVETTTAVAILQGTLFWHEEGFPNASGQCSAPFRSQFIHHTVASPEGTVLEHRVSIDRRSVDCQNDMYDGDCVLHAVFTYAGGEVRLSRLESECPA